MRAFLLNPPFKTEFGKYSRSSRSPAVTKSGTLYYPLWLIYVAGALEDAGHDVLLLDSCADGLDRKATYARADKFRPDLIILDTSTPSIYNDIEVGAELKDRFPNSFVVLMGTHPTALPEETLRTNRKVDAVIVGEAEPPALELAAALDRKDLGALRSIMGLSFWSGEAVVNNPQRPPAGPEALDKLPFAARVIKRHLNHRNYFFSAAEHPMVMTISGRGCPARCHFCVYPQTMHTHKYMCRSVENIIEEFKFIRKELPDVKAVGFEDDTWTFDKKRTQEFCRRMIEEGLNKGFTWWANVRVNSVDYETLRLMKRAGCRLLIPGFESSDQEILNAMKKGTRAKDGRRFMEWAHKEKMIVHGCFMLGNPGETKASMAETLKFACELNPDTAQFFPMIPYPGTAAYDWAKKNGYLRLKSYADYLTEEGLHNTVMDPGDLKAEDLVAFCDQARRTYYLRPSYIWMKFVQSLFNPLELKRNLMAAKGLFYHLLTR